MFDPITTFVGLAIVSGVIGNRSDAAFKTRWEAFTKNLKQHRPYVNDELARAAYTAYLQATLQLCAALLEQNHLKVSGWFKLGLLPEKMAAAMRSLLSTVPAGVFTQANRRWLEAVSQDHISKLKLLEKEKAVPSFECEQREFAALLDEIELLMRPEEAQEREQAIRVALAARVLKDLEQQFGEPPTEFKALVTERWFEFLCASFQYCLKNRQEIANAIESRLLAKLVARSQWQQQLTDFGGESLRRIEAAQEWLRQEQHDSFERIESLVTLLLPLLSYAREEAGRNETLRMLIRGESERMIAEVSERVETIGDNIVERVAEEFEKRSPPSFTVSWKPEPLIHTLPTHQEIEGRQEECATILRAMGKSKEHVLAFAAPGGFGKTALLAKVIKQISPDGDTLLERINLPNGETIETRIGALLHVDCRNDVKLGALLANAGRLIGQEQAFQDIYNSDLSLPDKLQGIFSLLSPNELRRSWFLFDNFEPLLDDKGEIGDAELRDFFRAIFAGDHNVYALVSGREVPRFSPREQILEITAVGISLFEGLPLDDCVAYLRKNDAAKGLVGNAAEIDVILRRFALRVHRIPLGLVWAVGYLRETNFTLKEVLESKNLFDDFEEEQTKDAERYENKGLKRLHYEQLRIQTSNSLLLLILLAVFKRAVPKGALAHLLSQIELNKTLTRLERNKLITRKEFTDTYTRYLNDDLAIYLYSLHPVICENKFFEEISDREVLYEISAHECWDRAVSAYQANQFAYAVELFDCAEKLFECLTNDRKRLKLLSNYATMLTNKGEALRRSTRLAEAATEAEKAIAILTRLVNVEQQTHLAHDLAMAYMNKGVALADSTRLTEAVAEGNKAIAILARLVNIEKQTRFAKDLATAYLNKGVALYSLTRLTESVAESDRAIAIFEHLVNVEDQAHLAHDLASAYINKGAALRSLSRLSEAVTESDNAIAILTRLVNVEQQPHLAHELARAYMSKGVALGNMTRVEAVAEFDKAIAILERLVNIEQQTYLTNGLAMAYINKGAALYSLTKLTEAITEFDKAIVILSRLVNVEQQTHLANYLAGAYMNKGVALDSLMKVSEAVGEYDKAIAILECLVNVDQQVRLSNELATAYLNKGLALERLEDWDSALLCYTQSLQVQTLCLEQLNMFWIISELLHTLRYRLRILLYLKRYRLASRDVLRFLSLYEPSVDNKIIDDRLKKAADKEFNQMIATLQALSPEQSEDLYAQLGDKAERVRSFVSKSNGE